MKYVYIIRNLREDHDYTQEYVAHILHTSQTMYSRYERGETEHCIIWSAFVVYTMFPPIIY